MANDLANGAGAEASCRLDELLFAQRQELRRTSRATCIQRNPPITATIRMKIPASGPNTFRSASRKRYTISSKSGRPGSARNMSVMRISA